MDFVGTYLCFLNVILSSILHNCRYMYLFVLGNLPLSLFTFTQFFFSKIGFSTASYKISIWRNQYLFLLSCFVWVLLLPILQSIPESEMGVESLKLVSLNVKGISNFHKRKTIYTWCRKKNADFSFFSRNTFKGRNRNSGKMNGGPRLLCHMQVQILVELPS